MLRDHEAENARSVRNHLCHFLLGSWGRSWALSSGDHDAPFTRSPRKSKEKADDCPAHWETARRQRWSESLLFNDPRSYGLRASECLRQAQDRSSPYSTGPVAHQSGGMHICNHLLQSSQQRRVYTHFTDEETTAQRGFSGLPESTRCVMLGIHAESTFLPCLSSDVPYSGSQGS